VTSSAIVINAVTPRPVHGSVEQLLAGCSDRQPFHPADVRSGTHFERVVVDGERFVLKHVHLDDDFTMRASGDLACRPLQVWRAGLMDLAPEAIDHAVVAVAGGDGRNGWGAALLLRDVSHELVPMGEAALRDEQHASFLDHLALMSARGWGWHDELADDGSRGLLRPEFRWRGSTARSWTGSARSVGRSASPSWPRRAGSASPTGRRPGCAG